MYNVACPTFSYVPTSFDLSMVQALPLGHPGPVPIVLPQADLVAAANFASNLNLGGIGRIQSGRIQKKEKKWGRTKWSQAQAQTLAEAFAESQEIGSRMSQLMDATGLPEKTIKVYFANHRARSKKAQKEEKPRKAQSRKLTEESEGYGSWEGSPSAQGPSNLVESQVRSASTDYAGGFEQGQYMNFGYPRQNLDIQSSYSAPAQSQAQFASGNYYCPSQNFYSNPHGSWDYSSQSANYYPQMAYCTPEIPQDYCNKFAVGNKNCPRGIEQNLNSEASSEIPNEDFLQNAMQIAGIESAEKDQAAPEAWEEDNWDEVLKGFENY